MYRDTICNCWPVNLPRLVRILERSDSQLSCHARTRAFFMGCSVCSRSKSMAQTVLEAKIRARLSSSRACILDMPQKSSAGVWNDGRPGLSVIREGGTLLWRVPSPVKCHATRPGAMGHASSMSLLRVCMHSFSTVPMLRAEAEGGDGRALASGSCGTGRTSGKVGVCPEEEEAPGGAC